MIISDRPVPARRPDITAFRLVSGLGLMLIAAAVPLLAGAARAHPPTAEAWQSAGVTTAIGLGAAVAVLGVRVLTRRATRGPGRRS
ncbi:hypothetical protein ABT160_23015 [Streptomyces sp. NPDC001941]|uniref:hypothetical protein n=1 Tax=Streptomyces sp. NPDC001941 TaxID=3154659 RepID=UPI00332178EF